MIIPVFNHWDLFPLLKERLASQVLNGTSFEVLLVDNGSTYIPDELDLPEWMHLLTCTKPGSYAARNLAVKMARGQLLAFTDADCLPDPYWLQKGWECFLDYSDRHTLIAGGISMEPQNWARMTHSEIFDVICGLPQERYVKRGYAVTANLFVPKSAFDEIGLFNEERFSGGDSEFCRRATSQGWNLRYCAEARVIHPARKEWNELKTKQRRVKGGQVTSGPMKRRFMYVLLSLSPPFRQCFLALKSPRLTIKHRLIACWIWCKLWIVGVIEVLNLLTGHTPERR